MALDRDVSLEGMQNSILNKMNQMAEQLRKKGEDAGEAIGEGFKEGVKDSAKTIKSSSSVITDAIENVADNVSKSGKKIADGFDISEIAEMVRETFDELKRIGKDTTFGGEFDFDMGSFSEEDLKKRIQLLKKLKIFQEGMLKINPDLTSQDFATRLNPHELEAYINVAESKLEQLRKTGLRTTEDLLNAHEEFYSKVNYKSWSRSYVSDAKEIVDDDGEYDKYLSSLRNFIDSREDLLKELDDGDIAKILPSNLIREYRSQIQGQLQAAQEDMEDLVAHRTAYEDAFFDFSIDEDDGQFEQSMDAKKKTLKEFIELWNKLASESENLDAFGQRYAHLFEAATSRGTSDITDLYDELISKEERYQEDLEEERRINAERNKQLQEFVRLSGDILPEDKRSGKNAEAYTEILNQITQEGLSASDALSKLHEYMKGVNAAEMGKELQTFRDAANNLQDNEFANLPETQKKFQALWAEITNGSKTATKAIEEFYDVYEHWSTSKVGDQSEPVAVDTSGLEQLSRKEVASAFKNVDLKAMLKSFSIGVEKNTNDFKQMFTELLQFYKALRSGSDVMDKFNAKAEEIVDSIMRLGSVTHEVENPYEDFSKYMAGRKIAFTDATKSDFTKEEWTAVLKEFPGLLVSRKNNKTADTPDTLYQQLVTAFGGFFSDDIKDEHGQLKQILKIVAEARAAKKSTKKVQALDRESVLQVVTDMVSDMLSGYEAQKSTQDTSKVTAASTKEEQKEAEALGEVEQKAEKAATAKKKFAEANKEVAKSAEETAQKVQKEKEAIEEAAGAIVDSSGKFDKIKTVEDASGLSKTTTESAVRSNAVETTTKYYAYDEEGNEILKAKTVVEDFKKRANQLKKESAKVELAQKTIKKFLAQFDNKTAGYGSLLNNTDAYKELDAIRQGTSSITDISQIDLYLNKMMELDTEYNKVTQNLRKGTKSMNPFVNAVNSIDEMDNKIKQAETGWNSLISKPAELGKKVNSLRPLLDEVNKYTSVDANGNTQITDIYKFAEAYGKLNESLKQVNSGLVTQRKEDKLTTAKNKEEAAQIKELHERYEKQAKSAANIAKYRSQLQSGTLGKEETRRAQEKLQAEKETQKELQKQIQTYGSLHDASLQQKIIDEKRQGILSEIADAQAKAADKQAEVAIKAAIKKREEELNALYQKRKDIVEETLKYTIALQKAGLSFDEIQNSPIMKDVTSRLHGVDANIANYGTLVDQSVLDKQDEILKEGLRKSNIQGQIDGISNSYKELIALQDSYYKKYEAFEKEQGNEQERERLLKAAEEAEKKYNDAKKQTNLTREQSTELIKKEAEHGEKLQAVRDSNKNKQDVKEQEATFKEIDKLYDKYLSERASYHKMSISPDAKSYVPQLDASNDIIDKTQQQLLALGVDIVNIEKSAVLTQEQKNKLLEKESQWREKIIKQAADVQAAENKATTKEQERINKQNQNYGKSRYNTALRNYDKIMASVRNIEGNSGLSANFQKQVDDYEEIVKKLGTLRKQFEDDPDAINDSKLTQEFQDVALAEEKARKSIQAVVKESEKLDQLVDSGQAVVKSWGSGSLEDSMKSFANEISNGTFKLEGFNQTGTEMYGTLINGSGAVEKITVKLKEASGEMVAFKTGTKDVKTGWDNLKSSVFSGIAKMGAMYLSFHDIIRYLRQGVEYVREIDAAMTELRKVTDETEATYAKFLKTASATASSIGSTLSDFTNVTSDFARLGYSIAESTELAKTALIYENVGDGFSSVEEASQRIISTMKAFGVEAENTMGIVDRFNEVGNNFAIDSKGIGDALQRSASALVEGGNSIDEAIALVTAANSVIQNPEQVGTALKTLSLRLRSTKIELEDLGEDAEGAATSVASLRAKLLGLTGGKVDIMLDETTFKNTTQILREMAGVWDEMDDISRAGALELMGGKRQANILSSIISNFETVEEVIETSANSAGSALAENQKYLESIQGHIDILTNSIQTMWNNTLNSGVLKFLIDVANALIKIVDNVGLINTAIGALAGYLTFKSFDAEKGIFALISKLPFLQNGITSLAGKLGLGTKATALFGSALSGLATVGIGLAITMLWKLGDAAIKTAKEIKESAKEAVDSYKSVQDELKSAKKTIEDISDDYKRLSYGVDELGNNVSLTTSEYERYNDIVNQIADMFPEMVRGYTDEGNAIIKNKGSVEALTEAYKALKAEANNAIIAKAADIMKDYKYTTEGGFWQWDDSTPRSIEAAKELEKILRDQDTYNFDIFGGTNRKDYHDKILTLLADAGISRKSGETNADYVKRAVSEFPGIVQSIVNTWESTVNAAISNVKPLVQAYLDTSVGYAGLTNEQKSVINSVASSFDEEFFNQFEGDASKMQQTIENMILNIKSSGIDDEYELVLSARTEFNNNQVTAGEYQETVRNFVGELERLQKNGLLGEDDVKYIKMSIGIDIDEDASIDTLIAHAQKLFNNKELKEKVLTLNYSDLQIINSDVFDVSSGTLTSWQELLDAIEKARIAATQDFTAANFSDYSSSIESITENLSTLQGAYDSLMSGDFTYADFLELVQKFPELADGVDTSSDSFEGLAKNLRKAIKNSPDELVDELKDLREQLVKAGKSTKAIDQLIDSMENLPVDKVDDLAEKYVTLADAIDAANQAQGELAKAMEENPNANYENTSEAVQKMREMYANGAYGSESEIWDIFEALTGQTYDFSKSLTENKDVLKDWINTYSGMYLGEDDGEYAHKPIEKFLNFMEGKVKDAKEAGEEWAEATTWTYENGTLDVDYDNKYLENLAKAAGLTEAAFHDLMMQVAQFWGMEWEDGSDIVWYMDKTLKSALESGKNADEVLKDLANAMDYFNKGDVDLTNRPEVPFDTENFETWAQYYREITNEVGKYSEEYRKWAQEELAAIESGEYTATVYSNTYYKSQFKELGEGEEDAAIVVTPILPDGTVLSPRELEGYAQKLLNGEEIDISDGITLGLFEGENAIDDANKFAYQLHEAQAIYYDALERFSAENILSQINDGGIDALGKIDEIKSSVSEGASGEIFVDTTSLIQTLTEAQYTEAAIVDVIDSLKTLQGVTLYDENSDPFGLYKATGSAEDMVAALENAGIAVEKTFSSDGGANSYIYNIDVREMAEVLASRGWTTNDIVSYINAATGTYGDGDIFANMGVSVDTTDIDVALGKKEDLSGETETEYTINVNPTFTALNDEWAKLTEDKKVDYIVNKKTVYSWGWGIANGTAHARGTAFAGGNWGAPRSETALVGELGPEMVVRGNRWFTVGDNGAEFTDIKKGDIIFNHKQTEDLLSKGYVSGRGKAFANGTAYSNTEGTNPFSGNADDIGYEGELSDAASKATEEIIDFIEIKLEEIEAIISKTSAKLETYADDASKAALKNKDNAYDALVQAEKDKESTYSNAKTYYSQKAEDLWKKIDSDYQTMAKNGAIAVKDFVSDHEKEQADIINEYREMAQKADDAEAGYYEAIVRQTAYRLEQIEDIADDYDNLINLVASKIDLLQANIDLKEEFGASADPEDYKQLIAYYQEQIATIETKRNELTNRLKNLKVNTDEWYQVQNLIAQCNEEIVQFKENIIAAVNAIEDIRWDSFEKAMDRLSGINSELENIFDLLSANDKDVVNEDGSWSDKGIAALGVIAQQMELAQAKSKYYGEQISQLKTDFANGVYAGREDVYYEDLERLTEAQWQEIKAYEDAKDAIVDLNKVRIDAVKDGIEKEIDAYKELIEKKKEALDADKDAYDFEKEVTKQQKEISDIRREIAALSGDTSASAVAKRKQLEAELLEAEANLEDTYYDRSIENQKNALDNSYEQFEKEKNDEMEALDKYLEKEEQVILDSMNVVKANTSIVLEEIEKISEAYGIEIADEIKKPWEKGEDAITDFDKHFKKFSEDFSVSAFTTELQKIVTTYNQIAAAARAAAAAMLAAINASSGTAPGGAIVAHEVQKSDGTYTVQSGDNLWNIAKDVYGDGTKWVDIYNANKDQIKDPNLIYADQNLVTPGTSTTTGSGTYTIGSEKGKDFIANAAAGDTIAGSDGSMWVKNADGTTTITKGDKEYLVPGYAKGTRRTRDDEFAWIDEIGEELVLHADGRGRLAYLTKGSSVIPADLTSKLMDLALDPTQTLENSRPMISAPHVVNNEINIDMSIAEVVHIDHVDRGDIPDLTKAVEKQLDKYMKQLNGQIRKYSR